MTQKLIDISAKKLSLTLLVASALMLSACGSESQAPDTQVISQASALEYVSATVKPVTAELELDGIVEAVNRAVASAQTSGRIEALPFDIGDFVPQGEVIARITSNEQRAGVNAARAQLEEAKAVFAEADQNLIRIKDVFERGVVSKAQLDQATAAQQSAAARVESAKAALVDAEQRLEYTTVIAPYSGLVVQRLVDVGSTVAPGSPILEGVSLQDLRVRVDVPQRSIRSVMKQRAARVILEDGSSVNVQEQGEGNIAANMTGNNGTSINAKKLRISPSANEVTHTFTTLIELPDNQADSALYPGTLVKVAFSTGEVQQVVVPDSAIARRGEVNGVYVKDGSELVFKYIRPGVTTPDGNTVVLSGLDAGEAVAVDPILAAAAYKQQSYAQAAK